MGTDCKACHSLRSVGLQCNHHRRTAPNATTLRRAAMVAHMTTTGATAAETERAFGVASGPVVGR